MANTSMGAGGENSVEHYTKIGKNELSRELRVLGEKTKHQMEKKGIRWKSLNTLKIQESIKW